jgi:phage recombination protein Bet
MTTAVVKTTEGNIVEMVKVLFPHLVSVSDVEIVKAVNLAKMMGLNPLGKECHLVPYKGSVQVVVSYLEYVKRAERSGRLNGWSVAIGKDSVDTYAEVIIHRKDWQFPFQWKTYLSEVKKDTPTWRSMPLFMLKKACITQAFRLAFPEEVAMLPYEEAEAMAETINETIPEPVKELPKEPAQETSTEEVEDEIKYTITEGQIKRLWAIAYATAKENKLSNEAAESIVRSVLSQYNLEHTKDIEKKDYEEIVEKIKAEIEEIAREGGNEE